MALEYSGYGKSSGEFTKGNISTWANDAKQTIKNIVKKNDIILIGSSMGAWISLLLFKSIKKQIKGFIGIGSAPEFLTRIMWKKFSKKTKSEIIKKGISKIKNGRYEYLITNQLIKDGRKKQNKVLNVKIPMKILVTMVHGQKDEVVPTVYSKKVLKIFKKAKKKMVIIKNGDHSLSNKRPPQVRILSFGTGEGNDFRARNIDLQEQGTEFILDAPTGTHVVTSPMIGRFNVMNLMASLAVIHGMGHCVSDSLRKVGAFEGVDGRM